MRYQQDLQVGIREQLRRLMAADPEDASHEIKLVTNWITARPALNAILAGTEQAEPGLAPDALISELTNGGRGIGRGFFHWPSQTEAGRAFIIWQLMRRIADEDSNPLTAHRTAFIYGSPVSNSQNLSGKWNDLAGRIIRPLFDYLSERVGAESNTLYVLERYVRQVQWFDRETLRDQAAENPSKAERTYNRHLRQFLFSEGINMPFTEAQSPSGWSDVLTNLDTDDPFLGEVKIYGAGRSRRALAGGFQQAVSYARDYHQQTAYLVIINLSGNPLELPTDGDAKLWPPYITATGIRVYFIAVQALPPDASASKQGKLAPVVITREDLVAPDTTDDDDEVV